MSYDMDYNYWQDLVEAFERNEQMFNAGLKGD